METSCGMDILPKYEYMPFEQDLSCAHDFDDRNLSAMLSSTSRKSSLPQRPIMVTRPLPARAAPLLTSRSVSQYQPTYVTSESEQKLADVILPRIEDKPVIKVNKPRIMQRASYGAPRSTVTVPDSFNKNNLAMVTKRENTMSTFPVKMAVRRDFDVKSTTWTHSPQTQQLAPAQLHLQGANPSQPPAAKRVLLDGEKVDMSFDNKISTDHGITASFSDSNTGVMRVNSSDLRWGSEDRDTMLSYGGGGAFEDMANDEEWISSVDVSGFEDISKDLLKQQLANEQKSQRLDQEAAQSLVSSIPPSVPHAAPVPASGNFPKPTWSYSSLIALALKNSHTGQLTVSEIYAFMMENFPYFRTAPGGWKNSVRHNLSLNKCFQKVEIDMTQMSRKSCLWMISPDKYEKLEMDIRKWRERGTVEGLARPQDLDAIENGTKGLPDMEQWNPKNNVLRTSYHENSSLRSLLLQQQQQQANGSRAAPSTHTDGLLPVRRLQKQPKVVNTSKQPTLPNPPVVEEQPRTPSPSLLSLHDPLDELDTLSLCPSYNQSNKRPFSETIHSPIRHFGDVMGFGSYTTPQKQHTRDEDAMSPLVRYAACWGSFDSARDALNDNSLMSAALEESPYKGPVTFPVLS